MKNEELIKLLAKNRPAIWIMWEVGNIKNTFKVPEESNGPQMITNSGFQNAELYDTIENLVDSVGRIIGLFKDCSKEEHYERFNMLEMLNIYLLDLGKGKRTFKIEASDYTWYEEFKA